MIPIHSFSAMLFAQLSEQPKWRTYHISKDNMIICQCERCMQNSLIDIISFSTKCTFHHQPYGCHSQPQLHWYFCTQFSLLFDAAVFHGLAVCLLYTPSNVHTVAFLVSFILLIYRECAVLMELRHLLSRNMNTGEMATVFIHQVLHLTLFNL